MRLQHTLAVGLLGLGFVAAPMLVPVARAADDTPKEAPKEKPPEGGAGRQGRGAGGGIERFHTAVLALELTDEQKPKIEAAFTAAKTKMDAATKDAGTDRAAMREKTQPIMEELRKAVDEVLTADQKAKLEKARGQRGGPGGPGGAGGRGGNRGPGGPGGAPGGEKAPQ